MKNVIHGHKIRFSFPISTNLWIDEYKLVRDHRSAINLQDPNDGKRKKDLPSDALS